MSKVGEPSAFVPAALLHTPFGAFAIDDETRISVCQHLTAVARTEVLEVSGIYKANRLDAGWTIVTASEVKLLLPLASVLGIEAW